MLCKRGSKRGKKTLRLKNVRRDTCPQPLVMSVCGKGRAKVSKVSKRLYKGTMCTLMSIDSKKVM